MIVLLFTLFLQKGREEKNVTARFTHSVADECVVSVLGLVVGTVG